MTKITFLNLHLGYGGIESSTINTVNQLCKFYEIEIISFYNLRNNQEDLINKKVKIIHLYNGEPNKKDFINAVKNKNILNVLREGTKASKILYQKKKLLKKAIKNSKSDFIVSTRYDFSVLLSKYKPNNSIAIAQEHHHHNNNKKYINILKNKYKNIDYVFALTKFLEEEYHKIIKNKDTEIILMPNMIANDNTEKSNLKSKNLISVGRLSPGKNVAELIDIYKMCKNVNKFYIIGDGEEFINLQEKIKREKLEDKVLLLGYKNQEEIKKYLLDSSIFVMSSLTEGLPMVLLESMNAGVPCIAYETESGIKDIIDDDKNGYIIKRGNKKKFAKKIDNILNNKEKLQNLSLAALSKAKAFSSTEITKRWQTFISSALISKENKLEKLFAKTYRNAKKSFLEELKSNLKNEKKTFIVTANPEAFMYGLNKKEYYQLLIDDNTIIVPDGIGLVKAGKMLGYNIVERIPGVELSEKLFEYANEYQKSIYLFGSKEEVIQKMKSLLEEKYPNAKLIGTKNGYEKDKEKVFKDIKEKKPDIVLVALGMPVQEELIYKHLSSFKKGIFIGVGGSFDVLSGTKKRAPKIFIKLNLEWLYRIMKEPKRIKRFYDNNVKFLFKIAKEKRNMRRHK